LPVILIAAACLCLVLFLVAAFVVPGDIHDSMAGRVGGYAPLYLFEPSPYHRIVVEVHYEQSAMPSDAALLHLESVLGNYTAKEVIISKYPDIEPDEVPSSFQASNVCEFGGRMISEHAFARTGQIGGDAVIYVFYVNASAPEPRIDKGNRVGGVCFRGDSFMIFKNNIRDEGEEKTVLVHETGHLLGLEHDDNQSCVMVGSILRVHKLNYTAPPPDDFCEEHRKQLDEARHHLPLDELFRLISIPDLRL